MKDAFDPCTKKSFGPRGYASIALVDPKVPVNVGSTLRAAYVYGASQVVIAGDRGAISLRRTLNHGSNTPKGHLHIPTILCDDPLKHRPHGCQLVVVDLIEGATPLPSFRHPEQAMYLFGPEDGTIGKRFTEHAQHVVYIPTRNCMNLAATVNVVLYDRLAKRGPA